MPLLVAKGIERTLGPRTILGGVDLSLEPRDRVGLVGASGAGKSTLARILAEIDPPDGGEIVYRGGVRVSYLDQQPQLDESQTPREIVRGGLAAWERARTRHEEISTQLGEPMEPDEMERLLAEQAEVGALIDHLGGWDADHVVEAFLDHLKVPRWDDPVAKLSGGERRRTALARLLVEAPDLAILDEPTNHLDIEVIEWLEKYLATSFDGAVILVTHDRYVLDRVCTRTWELAEGVLHDYVGGWSTYLEAKAEREAVAARTEANRQNFLRRELEWLRRSPAARTSKSKSRVNRANAAIAAKPPAGSKGMSLRLDKSHQGSKRVLEVKELKLAVPSPERGERVLVQGLNLVLAKGERLGIVGPNGAGKSTLIRTLMGQRPPEGGSVHMAKQAQVAYIDQHRAGLDEDATLGDSVANGRDRIEIDGRTRSIQSYLASFLFPPDRMRVKVASLSGGEKARLLMAKTLLEPANVMVLDEPTNDLDVVALGALEEMLLEAEPTALVVSHDRYFLDRVCTGILAFEDGAQVIRHAGGYSEYAERRDEARAEQRRHERAQDKAEKGQRERAPRVGLSTKERRELDRLETKVEEAEASVAALEEKLADPDLYQSRADEVPGLLAERDAAMAKVEELMARWEELEEKREAAESA